MKGFVFQYYPLLHVMCMIIELVLSRFRSLIFFQLMALLDSMSCEDVITWLPQGRGFVIFDKKKLAEEVLPRHFQGTKYTSFTRRLRRWNFAIQTDGHKRASYFHPSFIRGQPELCRTMVAVQQIRKKRKSGNLPTSQISSFNYANQSDISIGSSSNGASNTDNIYYQAAMSNNEIGGMAFTGSRGNSSMVQNLRSYAKNPQSESIQRKNGSSDGFTDQSQTNLSLNFPHSSIMNPNSRMDNRGIHSYPHHPSFMNNHLSQSDQLLMLQKRQEEQQLERNLKISNFMGATVQKCSLHDQHKNDLAVYDETQRRILFLNLVEQERRNMLLLRYQTSQHQQRIEPNTAIGNRHMHTTGIYDTTGALGGTHSNENNIIIRQQENTSSHIRSNYQGIEQSNSILAENEIRERKGRPSNSSTPRNYKEI